MTIALFNWSGGKDSSLALYRVLQEDRYEITGLLTSFNGVKNRVSMHGIRRELLEEQVRQIGLKLYPLILPEVVSMDAYDEQMRQVLTPFKEERVTTCIFGDIFLEDLKTYREKQLQKVGMKAVFPLWQESTERLAQQFIDAGFKAVVVSVDGSKLDQSFVGRKYDNHFLADLPDNVDPCGEYGSFHTFVCDGPIFTNPVPFIKGEIVEKSFEHRDEEDDTHSFTKSSGDKDTAETPVYFYMDLLAS